MKVLKWFVIGVVVLVVAVIGSGVLFAPLGVKSVHTELELDAGSEKAWALLTDFPSWSTWNPVIVKIDAEPRLGGEVAFEIHVDPAAPANLNANFSVWEEGEAFAWAAGLPGLFTGEHSLRIEALDGGKSRLTHGEEFGGLLPALMFTPDRLKSIEDAYSRMNEAFAAELRRGDAHQGLPVTLNK
jgi:hypothetical protein